MENNFSKKIKICVSGAAEMGFLGPQDYEIAKEVGKEIARQDGIIVTGATTGFPLWAAKGAKEEKGLSVGFSPATTEREHVETYRLPLESMDLVIYTGFGYLGRDLILTRSCDAVLIGPGRIGTIHEFAISYEDGKPLGILRGDWDTDEVLKNIMDKSHRVNENVFFADTPKELVAEAVKRVREQKKDHNYVYRNDDSLGGKEGERIL